MGRGQQGGAGGMYDRVRQAVVPPQAGRAWQQGDPHVDDRPTPAQAVLLVRWTCAKLVLARCAPWFLLKYVALAAGVGALFAPWGLAGKALAAVLVLLFVVLAVAQWLFTRAVRRLGAFDLLAPAEDALANARTGWWPNLRGELARVGLPSRPWGMLKLAAAFATRRVTPQQEQAFAAVDWRAVLPRDEWRQVRQALAYAGGAHAGGATGSGTGTA